jgi:hypothetical protein
MVLGSFLKECGLLDGSSSTTGSWLGAFVCCFGGSEIVLLVGLAARTRRGFVRTSIRLLFVAPNDKEANESNATNKRPFLEETGRIRFPCVRPFLCVGDRCCLGGCGEEFESNGDDNDDDDDGVCCWRSHLAGILGAEEHATVVCRVLLVVLVLVLVRIRFNFVVSLVP